MTIKDAVYAHVSGTVERVPSNPKAPFTVAVLLSSRDKWPSRVKVWPNGFYVNEGDRVSLKGYLSWRLKHYEKDGEMKHNVEVFLNNAELKELEESGEAQNGTAGAQAEHTRVSDWGTSQGASADAWNAGGKDLGSVPF